MNGRKKSVFNVSIKRLQDQNEIISKIKTKKLHCKTKNKFVDIWILPISDETNSLLLSYLSENEKNKLFKFHVDSVRNQYIHARGFLRLLLSSYLLMPFESLHIKRTPHGKPYLVLKKPFHFNLSHSRDILCIGITNCETIGVDIEYESYSFDLNDIALLVFSELEISRLNSYPKHAQPSYFYKIWTKKEACLKANGTGFLKDPRLFTVHDENTKNSISFRNTITDWKVVDIPLHEGVRGAFCIKNQNFEYNFYNFLS